jgi:hypothetical protein
MNVIEVGWDIFFVAMGTFLDPIFLEQVLAFLAPDKRAVYNRGKWSAAADPSHR